MSRILFFLLLIISGTIQAQLADFEKVDFHRADSIATLYKGENLKNLPILAHKLTSDLPTKLEKFRAIYTWVSNNIDNDYGYYLKNKKKRRKLHHDSTALIAWNNSFQAMVFKKLLKEQKTVCTGYAYLVRELAAFADIKCEIIDGYGRTATTSTGNDALPNHSWNAVHLNNKWYLCDATWSSGEFNLDKGVFVRDYYDGYFLAPPALFVKNHYPLNTQWILQQDKPELNEFMSAPLVYKHAFQHQIIPVAPDVMEMQVVKNTDVTFLLKVPDTINTNNIKLELSSGSNKSIVQPTIKRNSNGLLELRYKFKRLGFYEVHIKLARDYIVTYTIRVKRDKQ